ncbi:peptidase associated/transthyretin-like domain-containing protein [Pseudocnuella soli]|uniref:carboxypeptidase regulatory-like domain-containing protein n=1 Tax=Pseudocnuella soli TaxID=2502779 RepID=UPI00105069C7|nr:carboxypeptidase regulatory-like domain-containing protein [Pseudocnuella soli]
MKNTKLALLGLVMASAGILSFDTFQKVGIKGKVTPAESAKQAWAISATDTLKATITDGAFQFSDVQEGVYRIIVEANAPYKHAAKDSVVVKAAETTDVGEIALQQ